MCCLKLYKLLVACQCSGRGGYVLLTAGSAVHAHAHPSHMGQQYPLHFFYVLGPGACTSSAALSMQDASAQPVAGCHPQQQYCSISSTSTAAACYEQHHSIYPNAPRLQVTVLCQAQHQRCMYRQLWAVLCSLQQGCHNMPVLQGRSCNAAQWCLPGLPQRLLLRSKRRNCLHSLCRGVHNAAAWKL
jgi:hypothetical protein